MSINTAMQMPNVPEKPNKPKRPKTDRLRGPHDCAKKLPANLKVIKTCGKQIRRLKKGI